MNNFPRIGLTMRLEQATGRFYLGRDYSKALENFGAIPLHIGLIPNKENIRECVKTLDGILLPGSDSDVDPLNYNEQPLPGLGNVIQEKDETDFLVLEAAEEFNLPVFAICFGMQSLNVFRGGTLFQDIESQVEHPIKHQQGMPLNRNSHNLTVSGKGILNDITKTIFDSNQIIVNSHHHQSVKTPGENLKITARAKDDVIECIEDIRENRFIIGVQWHPELSWKEDKLSFELFKVFVEHCNKKRVL